MRAFKERSQVGSRQASVQRGPRRKRKEYNPPGSLRGHYTGLILADLGGGACWRRIAANCDDSCREDSGGANETCGTAAWNGWKTACCPPPVSRSCL